MNSRRDCPHWLLAVARRLLRLRFRRATLQEIEGDLVELWAARTAAGRRDRRRAFARDLFGTLRHRRPAIAAVSWSDPEPRAGFLRATTFGWWHDVRHAARTMRRQPMFAALTITTLALGIAGSTTMFSAIERLLIRPLPYPEPETIVAIENPPFSFGGNGMAAHPGMVRTGVLSAAGLYATGGLNLDESFDPIRVRAAAAEPGMFGALGVAPRLGRIYTAAEARDVAAPVAILSHALWRRQFGARTDILEQIISLNRQRFRIVGVMPAGFSFPDATEVWVPPFSDRQLTGDAFAPAVVARLAPGVPLSAAEAALQQFERDRGAPADDPIHLRPLQDELTRQVRPILLVLGVSVGLMLLVSCWNVAGLLLSRVASRQSEFVIRRALGGSRWRLARLLLVESLMLSFAAGTVGAAAAAALLRAIPMLLDQPVPDVEIAGLDTSLFVIAFGLSTITGLLFGLGPGIAAGMRPATQLLRASATATPGRYGRWFRHGLVAAQVGAALVLLVVMGSTVTRLLELSRVDLGFDGRGVIGLDVTLPIAAYKDPRAVVDFYQRAAARLGALPGVTQVAGTGRLPGDRSIGVGMALKTFGAPATADPMFASMLSASPQYFDALGVTLRAGRTFTAADHAGTPPVVILSESAAAALWDDPPSAVGRDIEVGRRETLRAEVVGVVADVKLHGPEVSPREARQLYRPLLQAPPYGTMAFAVRSAQPRESIAPALRAAIGAADPNLPVARLVSIDEVVSRFLTTQRLSMTLMSAFAMVTLAMAVIGLYGVLSTLVAQQTREIGIRMALGADRSAVRRRVVIAGARVAIGGVIIGALGSGTASTLIARFVPSLDAPTWSAIGGFAVVLMSAAVAAAWIPARRASAVDPMKALRAE